MKKGGSIWEIKVTKEWKDDGKELFYIIVKFKYRRKIDKEKYLGII